MIQKIDMRDMPGRATSYNNFVEQDIQEFVGSEWPVAEVKTEKYKTAFTAANAYRTAVKRMDVDVQVTARSGRVFLVRK